MNKSLIKLYASKIDHEKIYLFAKNEGININSDEVNLILSIIRNDINEILDNNALMVLEKNKSSLSEPVYNKILELYEKYKVFLV